MASVLEYTSECYIYLQFSQFTLNLSKYNLKNLRPIHHQDHLTLRIVKTAPYHFPNCPISTHLLGNWILQTLNHSQGLWTWIFSIWRTSAHTWISCRNPPHPLLQSCWLASIPHCCHMPHIPILCSQSEYSHNLWIILDGFIWKEWSIYFGI